MKIGIVAFCLILPLDLYGESTPELNLGNQVKEYLDKLRVKEVEALERDLAPVKRKGNALVVTLHNGKTREFLDIKESEKSTALIYRSMLGDNVIFNRCKEENGLVYCSGKKLIDLTTGDDVNFIGDDFYLSEGKKRLFSSLVYEGDGYAQIIRLSATGPAIEWESSGCFSNVTWNGDDEIDASVLGNEHEKNEYGLNEIPGNCGGDPFTLTLSLKLKASRWVIQNVESSSREPG